MITSIVHGLTIVRNAVAVVVIMGAAGATVAGAVDTSSGHSTVAAQSRTVATTSSGEQSAFSEVEAPSAKSQTAEHPNAETKPETKPTTKPDTTTETKPDTKTEPTHDAKPAAIDTAALAVLIKDCLARYAVAKNSTGDAALASEACRKAIVASGLSSGDFWSRFGPKTETKTPAPSRKPEETRKPGTTSTTPTVSTGQLEVLVKDCFSKYLITRNTGEGATAASEACNRAIAASGLSRTDFFARFGAPGSK